MAEVHVKDRAWGSAAAAGVVAPVLLAGGAVVAQLTFLGDVPDPVATHWGPGGPDGFSAPTLVPVLTAAVGGVLPVALGASVLGSIRAGQRGFTLRLMPAAAAGLAAFMATTLTWSLAIQRGLEDAVAAPSIVPGLLAALAIAVAVGAVAWLVQPRHVDTRPAPTPASALERAPGERAVWVGRTEMSAPALAAIIGGIAVATLAAVATWLAGDPGVAVGVTAVAVVLAIAAASFTVFHVRIDAHGLAVRSAGGLVRLSVPAEDVASVAAVEVSGMAQYGGFGIRSVPGATAVVMRSGEALEVTRHSGRRFVVTMDDAATAAAVLAAVAGDARAAHG